MNNLILWEKQIKQKKKNETFLFKFWLLLEPSPSRSVYASFNDGTVGFFSLL